MDTCQSFLDQGKDRATLFNPSCLKLYLIAFSGFGVTQRQVSFLGQFLGIEQAASIILAILALIDMIVPTEVMLAERLSDHCSKNCMTEDSILLSASCTTNESTRCRGVPGAGRST